ncbi:hypothetical protein Y032_0067g63 [Ancylostoma ceylanicum]|uniref:Uncharacterized protein n=1 Tax=Ancylostoma ceylanicum TaxID=53326 RepID=A0A016TZL8_9BILA|nr:hypothetical protein Y032_0067g63 [Ancylostoma ceylanicum]
MGVTTKISSITRNLIMKHATSGNVDSAVNWLGEPLISRFLVRHNSSPGSWPGCAFQNSLQFCSLVHF